MARLRSLKGNIYAMQRLRTHLLLQGEPVHRFNDDEVLDRIGHLLGSGRLHFCRPHVADLVSASGGAAAAPSSVGAQPPPPAPAAKPADSTKKKTWIEIELVDDQGQPVVGEKYRITLTDGSTREGALDSQGRARFDPLDPGICNLTFPNLDASEWKAA